MTSKELEALKGIKKSIAEHLHKQTGVSVEKHFGYLQNDTEISIIEQALTELEELKSWRDELNENIQDLISKTKHWEEKENKTDFEKGIVRGYKTMLHQLLVGIDFDKEEEK